MKLVLDIETTKDHSHIFLAVTKNLQTGEILCHTESSSLRPLLEEAELIIGHNVISFDSYLLEKLWKIPMQSRKYFDTLIMSRLGLPDRQGGHSLANWGRILSFPKIDFDNFTELSDEMIEYCIQDVNLTEKVYHSVVQELSTFRNCEQVIDLEHEVAWIIREQEEHGFKLDVTGAKTLLADLLFEMYDIVEQIQSEVPPKVVQLKTKAKVIPFNCGSRLQIGELLVSQGWKPKQLTPTGRPVVDEGTLSSCKLPLARKFERYLMLQKRVAQIESWIEAVDDRGYVHGKVLTTGTVTSRMAHNSPNMAQVPASHSPYGKECRALWTPSVGNVLVGVDASSLELVMLAHYMKDPEYISAVSTGKKEDGTDIHTRNMRAINLKSRDDAKTFIYAFLYGAGDEKIGSIVGKGRVHGAALKNQFLEATPALAKLKANVEEAAKRGYIYGLDGRKLFIRSSHAALNTLLQGGGAIIMKRALVIFKEHIKTLPASFVANVHDEWQIDVAPEWADEVGRLGVQSIEEAAMFYNLRCPLTGEYKCGTTWAETH